MKKTTSLLRLIPLAAALWLAGCATATGDADAARVAAPARFKEAQAPAGEGRWTRAAPAEAQSRGEWWRAFADPQLDALVARATAGNTGIAEAAARVAQARALVQNARSLYSPQISLGTGANRTAGWDTTESTVPVTVIGAGLNLSYEPDLFGRIRRAADAASQDAAASEALLQSTRLLVQAETAQTYLLLRATDAERALVRETVAAYGDTLALTERRWRAGDLAELDVARVQSEVASTQADGLALDRRRAELEHALAVLVGEAPASFSVAADDTAQDWQAALPVVPAGVPATVLARRPDVAAAQSGVLAAQARLGVAQAAWFPSITLTANGGYASPELGDLLKWSARSWGIGALLSLPLFDGGRREAGERQARARLDEAVAGLRGQVLTAVREVEDQLSALRLLDAQAEAQARAVDAARRAMQFSDTRYRNGMVSQLDLLDARRSELRNRRQALQVRSAQYQATVALVRALGGGWDGEAPQNVARAGR
ncbi:efflux transporter outer membrane subunit [Xylophilus sp.]|uniref:efflux transporter outer membrane subunit n=1 Tax=Xylophilus sp. TaxID=2653893 RepID=UPI0013B6285E|nr:efflux transporter outer membrane subunit [Xylophilus sp.]KAF1049236.1 MAG: Outer membrane protein OprM [Xylophilus sp.]